MRTLQILQPYFATILICSSAALSAEPEKPAALTAYEQCAARVFAWSDKVSDVLARCEAEMDAYLALQDEPIREDAALSTEREKPAALTAYEQCATRVFARSRKVSDVFARCGTEMEVYLALQDEAIREEVRQRAMAETRRALRAPSTNETKDNR
jgi:hypothetical protein